MITKQFLLIEYKQGPFGVLFVVFLNAAGLRRCGANAGETGIQRQRIEDEFSTTELLICCSNLSQIVIYLWIVHVVEGC